MEQSHDARSTPSSYEALARFDGLKKASIAPLVSPAARFFSGSPLEFGCKKI